MKVYYLLILLISLLIATPALAQYGDQIDTTIVDSTYAPIDTGEFNVPYYEQDTTYPEGDYSYGMRNEDEIPIEETFFSTRSGAFLGPTIEFTELSPHSLDPDLDGDIIFFGGQGYILSKGWMVGGGGVSATLYNLTPKYDEFSFGYGGFLTGYDQRFLYDKFSLRPSLLIGGGGLTMIKRRPDIADSTGHMILERYRDESFFCLRPGISLGFSPLGVVDFRLTVDYLYPIGGSTIKDLRKLTYGLQIMVGGAR